MLELPPLSLYVHVPWCVRKCPYCDFNSHETNTTIPETAYVKALCEDFDREVDRTFSRTISRPLQTIFIGGGTPSLFSASSYETLFDHIQSKISLASDIEITLEANPGTAESIKFRDFRQAGINRLSIGVQSFNDAHLQSLGRIHDAQQAKLSIDIARQAGFDNLNIDLMHGLPMQTADTALDDIRTAMQFNPEHLSWYQLTIEANTVFYRHPPVLPVETDLDSIQTQGHQLLLENGFGQYEVSAFSKPQRQAVHNVNYWQFGDYLGIGAGAHGKVSIPDKNEIVRVRKKKQPAHYLSSSINRDAALVSVKEEERPIEFLLNALRIRQGFSESLFESRTGVPFSTIGKRVEYLIDNKLLLREGDRITTSETGFRFLNSVLEEFLQDDK